MFSPQAHVAAHVDDYWHDLLAAADAEHVLRHCEACPSCRTALTDAKRRLHALEAVPVHEAPERLIQASLERIEQAQQWVRRLRRRYFGGVAAAAAIVAVVLAGWWGYALQLRPT